MEAKHVSEALKERKVAEGALKTSLFGNWKADYDSAAHHYEKAGQLFKLGKSFSESKSCYLEAAKCYGSGRVLFSAGKCHEAVSVCCKELSSFEEALHHIERAGDYYTQNGTPSTAISCYTKGAEGIADKLPLEAGQLYLRAGELERDNEHPREAIKCFRGAQKTFARGKMYGECMTSVQLSRDMYEELGNCEQVRKCNMSLVILHLARGDSVAARQSVVGDVSLVADELIAAVDAGDDEAIRKLAAHGDIVYLDTEIARIARFLTQDGAENVPVTTAPQRAPPTTTNLSIFKSSASKNTSSLHSERDELFGKSNKESRDELFSRSNKDDKKQIVSNASGQKDELFNRTTISSTNVGQTVPSTNAVDDNPFSADNDTQYSSEVPELGEPGNDEANPFQDSDEDLC